MPLLGRRFRRRPSLATILGLVLLSLIVARLAVDTFWPWRERTTAALHEGPARLIEVIDGQTLLVAQQPRIQSRVRLLGIEADPQVAEFIARTAQGKDLDLEFDKRRTDRHHCQLAYVYAGDVLLNEQLVREGLASVSLYPGDSPAIAKRLRAAESDARRAGRGRWSSTASGELVSSGHDD